MAVAVNGGVDVLIQIWNENRCGDESCEQRRLVAAMAVLRGSETHDAHARVVEEVMSHVAEKEPPPTTELNRPFEESVQALVIADAKNWSVAEWHRLSKDLRDRAEMGKAKYQTYLYPNNGRNSSMDAYQEGLDFANYLKLWLIEWPQDHEGAEPPRWLLQSYSTLLNTLGSLRREVRDD